MASDTIVKNQSTVESFFWLGEQNFIEIPHLQKYHTQLQLKINEAYSYNKNSLVPYVNLENCLNRYGFFVRRTPIPEVYNHIHVEVLHSQTYRSITR